MTNDELKKTFFKTAKEIKEKCEQKSMEACITGRCPFAIGEDHLCVFDWNNFGSPYEWEFDKEGGK